MSLLFQHLSSAASVLSFRLWPQSFFCFLYLDAILRIRKLSHFFIYLDNITVSAGLCFLLSQFIPLLTCFENPPVFPWELENENIFISTMTSAIYNLLFIPIKKNQNIISDLDSWESVDAKIGLTHLNWTPDTRDTE